MKPAFSTLLPRLDRLLRDGLGGQASREIEALAEVKIPRPFAATFASIAWRASLPAQGIRVLNPIVRPKETAPMTATAEEKAEYAACLIRLGAVEEAAQLLSRIEADLPRIFLYRAFVCVARWDYSASIPLLIRYLSTSGLSKYQRMVGQINLAAAYVHNHDFQKATYLLRPLLHESSVKRNRLALGRVLELSAENFINQKKWEKAEAFLAQAESVLADSDGIDLFFVRKFRAVAGLYRSKASLASVKELRNVKAEAIRRAHWETARDLDRFEAVVTANAKLFAHVYFGTPFEEFRREMAETSKLLSPPHDYSWRLGGKKNSGPTVELLEGTVKGTRHSLKAGQAVYRLFCALASDFYRPFRSPSLCGQVYPGDYYHPIHSPTRIRQVILRLRRWFDEAGLPLEISEDSGNYRLVATGPVQIHFALKDKTVLRERPSLLIEKLKEEFAGKEFSLAEAAETLSLNLRATQRAFGKAIEEGLLARTGRSKNTRYLVLEKGQASPRHLSKK